MPIDWAGIQTAILDRERARLGLPSRAELAAKAAEEQRASELHASQMKTAELLRDRTRAEIAAMPVEADLNRRVKEAQIANYMETPQPRPESTTFLERLMKMPPEEQKRAIELQNSLHPQRAMRPRLPIRVNQYDPDLKRNVVVWYDPDTHEEIRRTDAPVSVEEGKRIGTVAGTFQAIDIMRQLANDPGAVPAGPDWARPITGVAAQVESEITRSGKGADFDYAAQRAKDIVYSKTGAQLNETEQAQLDILTPRRDRGNLPEQVRRFDEYVRYLYIRYGVQDATAQAPRPAAPAARRAPSPDGAAVTSPMDDAGESQDEIMRRLLGEEPE